MRMLKDMGETGVMYSAFGLYKAGEAVAKVSSFAKIDKISWGLLFAQTVVPAINTLFFHNQFVNDLHLHTAVPTAVTVGAGVIAGVHSIANGVSKGIYKAFERKGY